MKHIQSYKLFESISTMYHVSLYSNRDSIMEKGLIPGGGPTPYPEDEYTEGTYLFDNISDARKYGFGNGDPFDIWEIKTTNYNVQDDPTKGAFYTKDKISASDIEFIESRIKDVTNPINEEDAAIASEPWQMNKHEWIAAGQPDLGVRNCEPEFVKDEKRERGAIIDYFRTFDNPTEAIRRSIIGVPRKDMDMRTRDKVFAKKNCWGATRTAIGAPYLEDVREAIIIGRLLGYSEHHILGYIFRNYVLRSVFGEDWADYDEAYKAYKQSRMSKGDLLKINKVWPDIKI